MKPIENSRIAGIAAISRITGGKQGSAKQASATEQAEAGMVKRTGASLAGTSAPVDAERVKIIREAVREGRYPLVAAQVADAIIAAGMFLAESPKTEEI